MKDAKRLCWDISKWTQWFQHCDSRWDLNKTPLNASIAERQRQKDKVKCDHVTNCVNYFNYRFRIMWWAADLLISSVDHLPGMKWQHSSHYIKDYPWCLPPSLSRCDTSRWSHWLVSCCISVSRVTSCTLRRLILAAWSVWPAVVCDVVTPEPDERHLMKPAPFVLCVSVNRTF